MYQICINIWHLNYDYDDTDNDVNVISLCIFHRFVFITGSGWFLLDTILAYPLQSAIIFLVVFFWSNISSYVTGMGSSKKQISEYRSLKGKVERLERRTEELKNRLLDLEVLLRHQEAEDS